jgi:hypothetical protein
MSVGPANIKVVVAAGVSFPDAIKASLPGTSAQFAADHGFYPTHVSACIAGRERHEKIRAALAVKLNVEREWLDEGLDAINERLAS